MSIHRKHVFNCVFLHGYGNVSLLDPHVEIHYGTNRSVDIQPRVSHLCVAGDLNMLITPLFMQHRGINISSRFSSNSEAGVSELQWKVGHGNDYVYIHNNYDRQERILNQIQGKIQKNYSNYQNTSLVTLSGNKLFLKVKRRLFMEGVSFLIRLVQHIMTTYIVMHAVSRKQVFKNFQKFENVKT